MSGKARIRIYQSALYVLAGLSMATTAPAQPLHSVMLGIPAYSEEALTWCGPATGQMIMEGYPSGACPVLQEDVWIAIGAHKTESQWDTDPEGLRGAMMSLCPPSGRWSIFQNTDPEEQMYRVAYWMTQLSYPVAILQDTAPHNSYTPHAEHWVAVRGLITDVDPTTSTTITLEGVLLHDPSPQVLGDPPVIRFLSGTEWYAEFQPVTKVGSGFHGKYVTIIEPPQVLRLLSCTPP